VINDSKNYTSKTNKGYDIEVINGITYIDNILIVNKTYNIPKKYGNGLTKETQNAFKQMAADAKSIGLNLYIASGYRSFDLQESIYNNYVATDGQEEADTYSARAGHSEHQTGLAFDLNDISDEFANTLEGKWVHDNCHKYGLIIRYPKGKDKLTGYIYEPWHLRYVGNDLAKTLYNNGNWITLEEHFGITSQYAY
jgi:D-alanyl-D-alanine carboxypeptidase